MITEAEAKIQEQQKSDKKIVDSKNEVTSKMEPLDAVEKKIEINVKALEAEIGSVFTNDTKGLFADEKNKEVQMERLNKCTNELKGKASFIFDEIIAESNSKPSMNGKTPSN